MQSVLATESALDQKLIDLAGETDEFARLSPGHSLLVAEVADRIAASFNLSGEDRSVLQLSALIRDVGELRMGRDYIAANRILTAEERLDLRRHPVFGEQEADRLALGRDVQLVIRWHHEWWNGAGYPDGLAGEEIPLKARILRVADAYCALIAARPFRAAYPHENARKFLAEWSGIEFDPAVVMTFLSMDISGNEI